MALRKCPESLMKWAMHEIFSGRIRDISSEGHGVVDHPEGRVFFVRGTWPGDEGEFIVESRSKKYGIARIGKLEKRSPAKLESLCPHFGWEAGQCGGCPWITVQYEAQLEQKQKRVEYLIQRNRLASEGFNALRIQPSPKIYGYRNRAQFKTNGQVLGYVSPETKEIAAIEDCLILSDKNRETLKKLKAQLPRPDWKPKPPYFWNFIDVNDSTPADSTAINRRLPFQQGNSEQNEFMKNWVREMLGVQNKTQTVIELFGGSGNFTEVLCELGFTKINSAELSPQAVSTLNAKKIPGVACFEVDLYKPNEWKKIPKEIQESEILFLDPPREGFSLLDKFIEPLKKLHTIVYISCEPYQWAGDIKNLVESGWKLKEAQPVDQFPHTPHIELLCVLEKG